MNKPLIIASNVKNERHQLDEWYENLLPIADGFLIVDTFSTDGTFEFFKDKLNTVIIQSNIIVDEGYGPARSNLRDLCKQHFPEAHWEFHLDGDERLDPDEFHQLRFLKETLIDKFDVIAFPRLNMLSKTGKETKNDLNVHPDYQARMTRLDSPMKYVRKLHEQVSGCSGIYAEFTNPKILHYHRSTTEDKRTEIGKLCAKLRMEDDVYGHTVPEHHKEKHYRELYLKEGFK